MVSGSGMQQVNLYLPELRPRRDWVNAARLVQAVAVMLAVMLLVSIVNIWQRSSLRAELADIQQQLLAQTARTEEVEQDVAARATDQALVSEMNTREQRIAQSQDLYDFMNSSNLGNLNGFSEYLMDLSRASFSGLWIKGFLIVGNAEHVSLQGNALQAAMLPDFVGRLAVGKSSIKDKRFGRLSTTRVGTDEELYAFVLETN